MKPIIVRPGSFHTAATSAKPSFGQARAEHMQQRLSTALTERRTLAAAQAGAQQTDNQLLQNALSVKERMAENKIDRISAELPQQNNSNDQNP